MQEREPLRPLLSRIAFLAPFDANRVLEKLNVCMDELPPLEILPQRPLSSGSYSDPNTLWTLSKFSKSQSRIKKGLESSSSILSSPAKREIERTYEMTIKVVHHHIFLQNRCDQLEASNRKQIKERAIEHKFTSQRGIFGSREDGQDDVVVEHDRVVKIYIWQRRLKNNPQNLL